MSDVDGNGHNRFPVEVLDARYAPGAEFRSRPLKRRPLWPALILFLLTGLSTLAVGAEFGRAYAENRQPFSGGQDPVSLMVLTFKHPADGRRMEFTSQLPDDLQQVLNDLRSRNQEQDEFGP